MEIPTKALKLSVVYCIITLSIKEEELIFFPMNISERTTSGSDMWKNASPFPISKKWHLLGRVQQKVCSWDPVFLMPSSHLWDLRPLQVFESNI